MFTCSKNKKYFKKKKNVRRKQNLQIFLDIYNIIAWREEYNTLSNVIKIKKENTINIKRNENITNW